MSTKNNTNKVMNTEIMFITSFITAESPKH